MVGLAGRGRGPLERTASITRTADQVFPTLVESLADRFGAAPALLSDQHSLTYRALAARTNQYARWIAARGLARGEVVCLLMQNCPEYMPIWLGISRAGGTVALLNTNLVGASLEHAINIVKPKHVIIGSDMVTSSVRVLPHLPAGINFWVRDQRLRLSPYRQGDRAILRRSTSPSEHPLPSIEDRALYIYTSGTTGLPKAASVSHFRLMQWSHWFSGMMDTRPTDRMYNCLPMYHSIGGVIATGAVLVSGGSVVLRQRFSATRFWDEVVGWDCTPCSNI